MKCEGRKGGTQDFMVEGSTQTTKFENKLACVQFGNRFFYFDLMFPKVAHVFD